MTKLSALIGIRFALLVQGGSLPAFEREEGQTLAEYALILAFIAIVVVLSVVFLGSQIGSLFSQIGTSI